MLGEDDGTVYLVDVELQVVATCVAVEAVGFSRGFWASISERDARRFNDSPHRIILLSSTVALAELADRRNDDVMQPHVTRVRSNLAVLPRALKIAAADVD